MSEHETIVYRLAQILIKLNQGERVEPKALADEFGVNLRTIQRDLNQRFAYLPMIKEDGRYRLEGYALGKLNTRDVQRFASLAGIHGLFPSLNQDFLREIFDDQTSAALLVRGHNYEDLSGRQSDFRLLESAINDHCHVSFNYGSKSGEESKRVVEPYLLLNQKGIWYLAAVDQGKLKTFAFARLFGPVALESRFKSDPLIKDQLSREDGIWFSEKAVEIVLKIAPAVAGYFKRRSLIANQVIEKELDDGGLIVSTRVGHVNQVLPIVRYWIPHIRIVNPDSLQRELEHELETFLRHSGVTGGPK
jgi:predicted DNA-binding transcriptional regulator YafY